MTAQNSRLVLPDSLPVGSPLVLDLPNVLAQAGDTLGLWEVWEITENSLTISTFSEGYVPLPAIPVRAGGRIDTLRFDKGVWISLPKVPDSKPAPIRDVLPMTEPGLPWLAPVMALLALLLAAANALLAASQKLGPMPKSPPPVPPATYAARAIVSLREQISHPDSFERARRILRRYLTEQFLLPAQSLPDAELRGLALPAGVKPELLLPMFQVLESASVRRYVGEPATQSDTRVLVEGLEKLVAATSSLRQREGTAYLMEEGLPASWGRQWLASQFDFLPVWLGTLALVFWLFPAWSTWPATEIALLLSASWAIGLVLKGLLTLVMTSSSWQATPGMKIWRLVLAVGKEATVLQRVPAALKASLPFGLGHFFNGQRKNVLPAEGKPVAEVRWYPLPHRANTSQ